MPLLPVTLLVSLVVVVGIICALFPPQHDFIEYWTASHLLMRHSNPYSLPEMFQMQKAFGWNEPIPLMFVCPPWALVLIAPLGLTSSYTIGWLGWSALLMCAAALSSRLLMDVYFSDLRIPEVSDTTFYRSLFVFTFYPVLLALKFSQLSPFLLLGLAGFLFFIRSKRHMLAGLVMSLTLLKPQLVLLVWIALLFWSVKHREWKILLGSLISILGATGAALLLDPHAFQQYRELIATPYLSSNASGLTAAIRHAMKEHHTYWLQFIPPLFGLAWFAFYWEKYSHHWNWVEHMPVLLTASVMTTAYGWIFDQSVLAVPIIAIAATYARSERRIPWKLVLWYSALNGTIMLLFVVPPLLFIPAPFVLTYWLVRSSQSSLRFEPPEA